MGKSDDSVELASLSELLSPMANDTDPHGIPLTLSVTSTTCPGTLTPEGDTLLGNFLQQTEA